MAGRQQEQGSKSTWILVAIVAIGALVAGAYLLLRKPAVVPTKAAAPVAEPAPPPVEDVLPGRAISDARVRELLGPASGNQEWLRWLTADDLLSRIAGTLDGLAEGNVPRNHLDFVTIQGRFGTLNRNGRELTSPKSYARYDAFAGVIGSLDAKMVADAYGLLKPWLTLAYRAFGYPTKTIDDVAAPAVKRVIGTPMPTGDVALKPQGAIYVYADPKLEALSPAEKQLLRMGPKNQEVIQLKVAEIARLAGVAF